MPDLITVISNKTNSLTTSITGVVLTLNEEVSISRALASLSFCDEVVVVDSGSTDSTEQIAIHHGARFVRHIQRDYFSITEQRNWILDSGIINSEWILFLDADEEIGEPLKKILLRITTDPTSKSVYLMTPRYWFLGKWLKRTQGYPNWHPRLLRHGCARFQGDVWESFDTKVTIGKISHPYEHYAFCKGLDDWLERHRRYATFDAEQISKINKYNNPQYLKTQRWRIARLISARLWWFMPCLRFVQKYILSLGFLEGWQSLLFSLMMSFYDLMIIIKIVEIRRREEGLSL